MNDLDPIQRFVEATRAEYEPSRADRERVKRRLLSSAVSASFFALLFAKASAAAANAGFLAGGQTLAGLVKLFTASLLLTTLGAGAVVVAARSPSASRNVPVVLPQSTPASSGSARGSVARAPQTIPSPPAPSSPEPQRELPSAQVRSPATGSARETVTATPLADGGRLEAELTLLQASRRAATQGQPALARRLLQQLDEAHPNGSLLEERQALRAVVACDANEPGRAERAAAFASRHPNSVYAARVESACQAPAGRGTGK